jgi:hypothetical protein
VPFEHSAALTTQKDASVGPLIDAWKLLNFATARGHQEGFVVCCTCVFGSGGRLTPSDGCQGGAELDLVNARG